MICRVFPEHPLTVELEGLTSYADLALDSGRLVPLILMEQDLWEFLLCDLERGRPQVPVGPEDPSKNRK